MRLSRPCYDKPHRCPGWAGGGFKSALVDRCDDGRINKPYPTERWWWFCRCDTCDVVTWPWACRWFAPLWWRYAGINDLRLKVEMLPYRVEGWRHRRTRA